MFDCGLNAGLFFLVFFFDCGLDAGVLFFLSAGVLFLACGLDAGVFFLACGLNAGVIFLACGLDAGVLFFLNALLLGSVGIRGELRPDPYHNLSMRYTY